MSKIAIATAMTLMCTTAFAQGTGPAPQTDTMNKPGMSNGTMDNGSMGKDTKGSTNNTTGMNKNNMKKDMSKEGSPSAMKKDGMSK